MVLNFIRGYSRLFEGIRGKLIFIRGYSRLFEESSLLFEVIRGYSRKHPKRWEIVFLAKSWKFIMNVKYIMLCFMLFWQVSTKTSTDLTHIDIFYAILISFNEKHPNSTHIDIFHAILISFNKKIQIWHILIYFMLFWQFSTKTNIFDT